MTTRVGVDVGGTFSDFVILSRDSLRTFKAATSTPQSAAIIEILIGELKRESYQFFHGTTVATNALLEGRGARVALVTTSGFEDVIEIARQKRASLYDLAKNRPEPLVARDHRIGHRDAASTLDRLRELDPDSIAVGFLGSYRDSTTEEDVADLISRSFPETPLSTSSELSPGFREYERLATTVLNAYLAPVVGEYLEELAGGLSPSAMFVMTSAGGLLTLPAAQERVGQLTLSGPAGGVVASLALRDHHELGHAISFDMGGTSTDVARLEIDGITLSATQTIGSRVNRVPSMPIHTVGAGGGSIAWADAGGALRVGPMSAGARPGPASYGLGGSQPTVTDANVYLGYIPEAAAFGSTVRINRSLAATALEDLGKVLGMRAEEVAKGVLEVVEAHMERAIRAVSVEQGFDPREAVLIAYGGAGGLHASRLARRLGMRSVVIPPHAGVFSAVGLLLARPRVEVLQTVLVDSKSSLLGETAVAVRNLATQQFKKTHDQDPEEVELLADVRYASQSHELTVAFKEDSVANDFAAEHEKRFGFRMQEGEVEVVNMRGVATGAAPAEWTDLVAAPSNEPMVSPDPSSLEERPSLVARLRSSLGLGVSVSGPVLITDDTASILVGEDETIKVLADGTLEITW